MRRILLSAKRPFHTLAEMDEIDLPGLRNCVLHPDRDAVDKCAACGADVCGDCITIFDELDLCPRCVKERQALLANQLRAAEEELKEVDRLSGTMYGASTDQAHQELRAKKIGIEGRIQRIKKTLGFS